MVRPGAAATHVDLRQAVSGDNERDDRRRSRSMRDPDGKGYNFLRERYLTGNGLIRTNHSRQPGVSGIDLGAPRSSKLGFGALTWALKDRRIRFQVIPLTSRN